MEEKNQNIEESSKKDLTQEEIEEVQGGYHADGTNYLKCPKCGKYVTYGPAIDAHNFR